MPVPSRIMDGPKWKFRNGRCRNGTRRKTPFARETANRSIDRALATAGSRDFISPLRDADSTWIIDPVLQCETGNIAGFARAIASAGAGAVGLTIIGCKSRISARNSTVIR